VRVLLDTCVVSELQRQNSNSSVVQAVEALDSEQMFLSVISVGEIAKGIALLIDGKKRRRLTSWLQSLEQSYGDRILGIDLETSHTWGEIAAASQKGGRVIPAADGLIAATAIRHGLRVMTRNVEHFAPTGVLVSNPWI
jgi:predicted nucleic acid-binding protein